MRYSVAQEYVGPTLNIWRANVGDSVSKSVSSVYKGVTKEKFASISSLDGVWPARCLLEHFISHQGNHSYIPARGLFELW